MKMVSNIVQANKSFCQSNILPSINNEISQQDYVTETATQQ